MGLMLSESRIGAEALKNMLEELGTLLIKGYFSKVDTSSFMKTVYLTFLEKVLQ